MSGAEKIEFTSVDEYLAAELLAQTKSEYVDGWIRAMTGATNRHNQGAENCFLAFALALK